MTDGAINAREGFGRLFVLGGFALVKSPAVAGAARKDSIERATRQRRSVGVRILRDVSEKLPTGFRREKDDDRAATERGEDEGMLIGPS